MALTLKRKSLKKTSKKNVQSRKRNNKSRKNMKTSETMRGGKPKPVYQYVEKKHLKEGLSNTYTKNYKKNKHG